MSHPLKQIHHLNSQRHRLPRLYHCVPYICALIFSVVGTHSTATTYIANKKIEPADTSPQHRSLTLRIELSPALCTLQPKRARLRQCREGFAMTVYGLRPEPHIKDKRCSAHPVYLPPLQTKVISRVMPDKAIRNIAGQYYGACMGVEQMGYFRMITQLASQLKVPTELSSGNNYVANRILFEQQLRAKNKNLPHNAIQMVCQASADAKSQVLTELQVCYDNAGKFSTCQQKVKTPCPMSFVILGLP